MTDLLKRTDPAIGVEIDEKRLRGMIDEKIALTPPRRQRSTWRRHPWVVAMLSFAVVLLAATPTLLNRGDISVFAPTDSGLGDLPGIHVVSSLAAGGVQTMAADGDVIWVMSALANELQEISASSGRVDATYDIDAYVEGVVPGGGYIWLLSYDNGGEVLRFDPMSGAVDMHIPIHGPPGEATSIWSHGFLWVSNDEGILYQISASGNVESTSPGELKGEGLGYLWFNDPSTNLITSLGPDGVRGELTIPTDGTVTSDGSGIRLVTEAGGHLWLMEGDYPYSTAVTRYDPTTRDLTPIHVAPGLLSMVDFDGSLWVTSNTDHVVVRLDTETGDQQSYPVPGKAGGLLVSGGSLFATLYHPATLIRLDPGDGMIETGEIVSDLTDGDHRLLCTGSGSSSAVTTILEPNGWIDYGSWSVIQAELSQMGNRVCADGYLAGDPPMSQRADDLAIALAKAGISGPYLVVAAGDGVHTARGFASSRDDVAGMVLVDPTPVGFQSFYDATLPGWGHPPWDDIEQEISSAFGHLGSIPLTVIRQDPNAVWLSDMFVDAAGRDSAQKINEFWQEGLDSYEGLSTDAKSIIAKRSGLDRLIWDRPDLIVQAVTSVVEEVSR
jgi:hypothetical protein